MTRAKLFGWCAAVLAMAQCHQASAQAPVEEKVQLSDLLLLPGTADPIVFFPNIRDLFHPKFLNLIGTLGNDGSGDGELTVTFFYQDSGGTPNDPSDDILNNTSPVVVPILAATPTLSLDISEMIPFCPDQVTVSLFNSGNTLLTITDAFFIHKCLLPVPPVGVPEGQTFSGVALLALLAGHRIALSRRAI